MLLVEIGTAGAISAYFYRHITSDLIERQPVQLSDYLFVFGCSLVFWLLVLLRAKLHGSGDRQADIRKVAKLAKLIALITTLNLCGCLLAPFMKLPLLVRFLVLFQVSSNLALLLVCMILLDAHTQQQQKPLRKHRRVFMQSVPVHNIDGVGGKDDEAGGSGSGHAPVSADGGRGTNTEQAAFESSKIIEMSFSLAAQTTGTLMGFHLTPSPSSSSKVLLVVALMDQLVAFLCAVTGILLILIKPEDLNAAKIFAGMGFFCYSLGYILAIAMTVVTFVPWYSVFIVVLLFGVVWLILFRNELKNSTQPIKNYIEMLLERWELKFF